MYNIALIKAADLEILAQQLAAEHRVERTTMLRALLGPRDGQPPRARLAGAVGELALGHPRGHA